MRKVTFELPDNAAAISMAIVISDFVGATLGIGSQDIRDMNTSVDEKAALLADRIRKTFEKGEDE